MSVESCYQLASKLDLRTSLGMFALWGGFLWVGSSVQNSKSEEEKIIDIHILRSQDQTSMTNAF